MYVNASVWTAYLNNNQNGNVIVRQGTHNAKKNVNDIVASSVTETVQRDFFIFLFYSFNESILHISHIFQYPKES